MDVAIAAAMYFQLERYYSGELEKLAGVEESADLEGRYYNKYIYKCICIYNLSQTGKTIWGNV
jgi:hypothetical protein